MDIVVSEDLNGAVKFSSSLPHPNNLNRYVPGLSSSTSVAGPSFLKMGVGADVPGSSDPGPAVVYLGLSTPSPPVWSHLLGSQHTCRPPHPWWLCLAGVWSGRGLSSWSAVNL